MIIVGISAYYHDSAAVIIRDGKIIAAAQEERFTRKKHDAQFPIYAVNYCLKEANINGKDINYVAFYDKPFLKFERLLETYMAFAPRGFESFFTAIPIWLKEKLFLRNLLVKELLSISKEVDWNERLLFNEHHLSHAASAFYPSPFNDAAVLTLDGVGEWATSSIAIGQGNNLKIHKEINFPHSLGLLYSAFTYQAGFKVNSGEYKLMGLAPYGEPRFVQKIYDHLLDVKPDGSFCLDMDYFDFPTNLKMTNERFSSLFGKPRKAEDPLTQNDMDLAASVQVVTEEVMLKLTRNIALETGLENLCLAGGVALNCVANGKILRDRKFKNLWIQPAAGDSGGALGAALSAYYGFLDIDRTLSTKVDHMQGSYLGPSFMQEEIERRLKAVGASFDILSESNMISRLAQDLAEGKAAGWFQGRMEFGPRALGARSILGDPRSPVMQSLLNLKVKYRESFRPFAPSILREDVSDWFELDCDSDYMLLVADVKKSRQFSMTEEENRLFGIEKLNVPRSEIPAVTHIDYSARVQTVHSNTNPLYHKLLTKFKAVTGCPVLINTSFNIRGEPIVNTPEDAFRCFMGTEIDILVLGRCYLQKKDQDSSLKVTYKNLFELD